MRTCLRRSRRIYAVTSCTLALIIDSTPKALDILSFGVGSHRTIAQARLRQALCGVFGQNRPARSAELVVFLPHLNKEVNASLCCSTSKRLKRIFGGVWFGLESLCRTH